MSRRNKDRRTRKAEPESRVESTDPRREPAAWPSFWKRYWIAAVVLFVLPFIVYGQTATFGYVLDDKMVVTENTHTTRGLAGLGDILARDSFHGYFGEQRDVVAGGRYRPLSLVTFAIEHQVVGLNAGVGHLTNVLLYALTAVLLLRVLVLLLPPPDERRWFATLPFIAAALWVLHPVHSEAVANIKGRDEILSLLLALATLLFGWRFMVRRRLGWLAGACAMLFLALLGKENAITFLAVVPLAMYVFGRTTWSTIAATTAALAVTVVIYIAVRYQVLGFLVDPGIVNPTLMNDPFVGATSSQRYATVFYTLALYLKLLVVPFPLTHDYYPYHIPLIGWSDARAVGSLALYLVLVGAALVRLPKRTVFAFCVIFFIATLSIVSNLVIGVGTFMNERFIYTPSVAFCVLLPWLLLDRVPAWFGARPRLGRTVGLSVTAMFAIGFTVLTLMRVPDWKDPLSLNAAGVRVSANSARVNCFYGVALYQDAETMERGDRQREAYELASRHLERAGEIYPTYGSAALMRAGVATKLYGYDRDLGTLLEEFLDILADRPQPFIEEYLEYLGPRNADDPALPDFYHRAGYELLFRQRSQHDLAIRYLGMGLDVDADNAQLLYDLVRLHYARAEYDKALEYAERGLQQDELTSQFEEYARLAQQQVSR